jgi:uncharacterized protein with PIN domain
MTQGIDPRFRKRREKKMEKWMDLNSPGIDPNEVLRKKGRLSIRRCPRCGGPLFPAHALGWKDMFMKNFLKCFSCARFFFLVRNGTRAVWIQWPERKEEINEVVEEGI